MEKINKKKLKNKIVYTHSRKKEDIRILNRKKLERKNSKHKNK